MTEAAHDDGATGPVALGGTPWRGTDVAEAQRVTLGELGADHWPVLPELPDRGPGAEATGRSAALLQELAVDLQPHGWRVSPPGAAGSGRDRRRAVSLWHEDAHRWADTAGAEGAVVERLAVRVRGPQLEQLHAAPLLHCLVYTSPSPPHQRHYSVCRHRPEQ